MNLEALVEAKERIISNSESVLLGNFGQIEITLYRTLLKYLVTADLSVKKINETFSRLSGLIDEALNSSGYVSRINGYLTNFDQIYNNISATQKSLNSIDIDLKEITKFQEYTMQSSVEKLLRSGINENFTKPLNEALYKHIVLGGSIGDAEIILKNYILSEGSNLSVLQRYVSQVSRDALMQYDGAINSRIAQKFNMTARRYVGSIIKDSRGQCMKWTEMGILTDQQVIQEINWALQGGVYKGHKVSGMIEETTLATFNVYRGGYNCRHSAIPTLE